MTDPYQPAPRDYDKHADPIGQVFKYFGGLILGFVAMFVATFIGGASSFEQKTVWWAWPLVIAVAIPVAILAWMIRRQNPVTSA